MIDEHTHPFSQNTITIISVDKGGLQDEIQSFSTKLITSDRVVVNVLLFQ